MLHTTDQKCVNGAEDKRNKTITHFSVLLANPALNAVHLRRVVAATQKLQLRATRVCFEVEGLVSNKVIVFAKNVTAVVGRTGKHGGKHAGSSTQETSKGRAHNHKGSLHTSSLTPCLMSAKSKTDCCIFFICTQIYEYVQLQPRVTVRIRIRPGGLACCFGVC